MQLGIRREDKNPFERRVPLTPADVMKLRDQSHVQVVLQPSSRRVFTDDEYKRVGASISESLDSCDVILGVKEIPPSTLLAGKTYVFFSHTIKGQPKNMPMLKRLLDLGCNLIDYERILDEKNQRLVFFGRHAGLAGMIDTLWALGQRLEAEGLAKGDNPFAAAKQAHRYTSLAEAKVQIQSMRGTLDRLPDRLRPLVFGFTGYGNVSQGAQEILDLLQPHVVPPARLAEAGEGPDPLIKVVFHEQHLVEHRQGAPFELQDYYDRPERYSSTFEGYLEQLSVLVNCIYWDARYPRLVTLDKLREMWSRGVQPRLRVIGDISCDIEGSIEATVRCTVPDNPVYLYNPLTGKTEDGCAGEGPVILAVDNLPAELPREASESFSMALMPFVPSLASADFTGPFDACDLPDPIRRAVIVYQGELTEEYSHLSEYLASS